MFFCERCRFEKGWHTSIMGSVGPCEMCGHESYCHDVPSKCLSQGQSTEPLNTKLLPAEDEARGVTVIVPGHYEPSKDTTP